MISFIVAMDDTGAIGKNNNLPWHLPEDLKYFKRITMGHPIVMGRKTFESIGRPLPGRKNIIITRNPEFSCDGCTVFYSVPDFIDWCERSKEEIFIIGGAEIFRETFQFADRLYITLIHHKFSGDTFFPDFSEGDWELKSRTRGIKDEKNPFDYDFCLYERKG